MHRTISDRLWHAGTITENIHAHTATMTQQGVATRNKRSRHLDVQLVFTTGGVIQKDFCMIICIPQNKVKWKDEACSNKWRREDDFQTRAPNDSKMTLVLSSAKIQKYPICTPHKYTTYQCLSALPMISYMQLFSGYGPFWGKCTKWPQNELDIRGQNCPCAFHWKDLKFPHICPMISYDTRWEMRWDVLSSCQILKRCTKWPKNELDMFKFKSTHMHSKYITEALICMCFALRWAFTS